MRRSLQRSPQDCLSSWRSWSLWRACLPYGTGEFSISTESSGFHLPRWRSCLLSAKNEPGEDIVPSHAAAPDPRSELQTFHRTSGRLRQWPRLPTVLGRWTRGTYRLALLSGHRLEPAGHDPGDRSDDEVCQANSTSPEGDR